MATGKGHVAVKVEGLKEKVAALKKAGVALADLKDAFKRIGTKAVDIIQPRVPVRSGRLRASVRPTRAANRVTVLAGKGTVPYAGVINYGDPKRRIKPAGFFPKSDPEAGDMAREEIERELSQLAKKVEEA